MLTTTQLYCQESQLMGDKSKCQRFKWTEIIFALCRKNGSYEPSGLGVR